MPDYNKVILSVPTSGAGATPAATYAFFTRGYKPPRQARSIGFDYVHNQNGLHKYVYDNGPNINTWDPFQIVCGDQFKDLGSASVQFGNLLFLWNYIGPISMQAPEGAYTVAWADAPLEKQFAQFPSAVGDKIEFGVTVTFEET
jgi:hypothetical protein